VAAVELGWVETEAVEIPAESFVVVVEIVVAENPAEIVVAEDPAEIVVAEDPAEIVPVVVVIEYSGETLIVVEIVAEIEVVVVLG